MNEDRLLQILTEVVVTIFMLLLLALFISDLFPKKHECSMQWTVIDRYIIADKDGRPNYYTVAQSNTDKTIISQTGETIYYTYHINDPANVCTYYNRLLPIFATQSIEGERP